MDRLAASLATCFGLGRVPFAPGTAASAVALPIGWAIALFGGWETLLLFSAVLSVLGIWACGSHARARGVHDPSECVIDEVAGQWIALIGVAMTGRLGDPGAPALAFVLFRFFDITKLWPISRAERLPGGTGIMADDLLAGVFAALLVVLAAGLNWI